MRKLLFIVFIVISFLGSFILANHFDNKNGSLPTQLGQGVRWLEYLFSYEEVFIAPNNESAETKSVITESAQYYTHGEAGRRAACIDTSLGEVKYKKVGSIYTWIDENEIYHVSDTPPDKGEFKLLNYAGEKVFDYFSLDLNTESLPYDFNKKLTAKLNKLFYVYGKLLDTSSLKKADINLRVYRSKLAFNQIRKQHGMPSLKDSPGFYSHNNNQAYILFTDNDGTMRTATHEATHSINRAVIGYTPRWLNEGLAEYSEYIKVKGRAAYAYPNKSWIRQGRLSGQILPLSTLFSIEGKHWSSDLKLRKRLYATSWAFTHFMMENPNRRKMLARVIKREQKNMCDVLNVEIIKEALGLPLERLQKQFSRWRNLKIKAHSL